MHKNNLTDSEYKLFSDYLEKQCGIVLGENKQYLVKSRLSPVLMKFNVADLSSLVNRLSQRTEQSLRTAVIDAMTTNETLWFRDVYPFDLLKKVIMPAYQGQERPMRIWSAACSSGQEPYSLSMTTAEYQIEQTRLPKLSVEILATDISVTRLEYCKAADYDELALARGLSPERRRQFFEPSEKGKLKVKQSVRQNVTFRSFNLLDSYALLGKFDVIFCRNVLIYFSAEVKTKIIKQFAAALNRGGYLILGASESVTALADDFDMLRCNPGIIYQKK